MQDDQTQRKTKVILEIHPTDEVWKRYLKTLVNASPTFLWAILTFVMLYAFAGSPELSENRDVYLNLFVTSMAYSVLSFVAAITVISWLLPAFNPRKLMEGDRVQQAACLGFWGLLSIALAVVIASVA